MLLRLDILHLLKFLDLYLLAAPAEEKEEQQAEDEDGGGCEVE